MRILKRSPPQMAMASDAIAGEAFLAVGLPAKAKRRWSWVLRRASLGLLTLIIVSTLAFIATQALPSDPARAILGRSATPDRIAVLNHQLGLDKPLPTQYANWLLGVAHADFGKSLASGESVTRRLDKPILNSLILLTLVALVALPISVLAGALAAVRRDGVLDRAGLVGSLVLTAIPEFVIAIGLVILFSTTLFTVFPAVTLLEGGETPLSHPDQLVLPVATLVLAVVPYMFRLVRASMIEVLASDYVEGARLKGIPEGRIMLTHALPNAIIPTVQASALVLTYLLGGVVVVEFVFGYPGVGSALTQALGQKDVPVIQAVTLLLALGVVVFNVVADFLTLLLSPRLRTGQ